MAVHPFFWKRNFSNESGPEYSSKILLLGHHLISYCQWQPIHRLTCRQSYLYKWINYHKHNLMESTCISLAGITCYYARRNCRMGRMDHYKHLSMKITHKHQATTKQGQTFYKDSKFGVILNGPYHTSICQAISRRARKWSSDQDRPKLRKLTFIAMVVTVRWHCLIQLPHDL